jgi:phosphate transport system substrate-binding protein
MKKLIAVVATLVLSASLLNADTLVIKGSDTLGAKLVPQLKEAFAAENPGITFDIAAEGSTTGFAALIDQTADIAMASRRAKPSEMDDAQAKGLELKATTVAWDGIAVIVNSENPVKSLTKKQVEQIFAGDITDWSAVGGTPGKISVYTRNTSSGTFSDFKELAMNKRDYAPESQKLAGNEQIASEVGKNAAGIGYVGLAYIKANGVKVAPIDGKTPTASEVRDRSYPYSRPTFYYTNGEPKGAAKSFMDFTLSAKGQKIVEQVGFVPLQ